MLNGKYIIYQSSYLHLIKYKIILTNITKNYSYIIQYRDGLGSFITSTKTYNKILSYLRGGIK